MAPSVLTTGGENPLAFLPVEMPYLLLNEDIAEDAHSDSSSGGMDNSTGIDAQVFSIWWQEQGEAFQMNSETFSIIW